MSRFTYGTLRCPGYAASMVDMERFRITGLQPEPGAYPNRRAALASFVRDDEGWLRHAQGFIVFHHADCTFATSPEDECSCEPLIIPQRQGRNNH